MLNIALPKGRMGDKVYKLFSKIGYDCAGIDKDSRRLVFENSALGLRYLLVKPADVAIYVERGAADIGVVGKDIILETAPDIYELLDLKFGACRIAVAAKNGFIDNPGLPLRVATKYPNISGKYFSGKNRQIDIIKLSGSIELAPILDLSDVIVDIVETGSTLVNNGLSVITEIASSSARLIANKSAFQFNNPEIESIRNKLSDLISQGTNT